MPECAVDDCSSRAVTRGWCGKHYQRWRKYGDPLVVKVQSKRPCTVDACERYAHAHGFCAMHLVRWKKHGDPLRVDPIRGRPLAGEYPTWTAVHKRLSRGRGPASGYACVDCGGRAGEWSYDGLDPDELVGRAGVAWMRYSLRPERYQPRCTSCHRKYDGAGDRPRNAAGQFE